MVPTPEQGAKIQTHLDRAVGELQAIRLETIARSTNVIWRLVAVVELEPTPEQRQAFEVEAQTIPAHARFARGQASGRLSPCSQPWNR